MPTLLLAFASSFVAQGSPSFPLEDLNRPLPVVSDVREFEFMDLDGDGDKDILLFASPWLSPHVRAIENDGAGNFAWHERAPLVPPVSTHEHGITLGDLDNDGDQDFVAGGTPFFNDGGGRFTAGSNLIQIYEGSAVIADLSGDGNPDIALRGRAANGLFLGDGAGGFVDASSQLPAIPSGLSPLVAFDVDLDGDIDLASGHSVLSNDGAANFVLRARGIPPAYSSWMEVADADGDGYLDVFTVEPNGQLTLFRNDAGIRFLRLATLAAPAPNSLTVADLNGDGAPDVLSAEASLLLVNDGRGNFTDASSKLPPIASVFGFHQYSSQRQRLDDVDGDGDLDVLFLNSGSTPVPFKKWLNTGDLDFVEAPSQFSYGDFDSLALGDIDGDGDLDLIGQKPTHAQYSSHLSVAAVRLNDGSGAFTDAPDIFRNIPPSEQVGDATDLAVGDVDGDGDLDLLWVQKDASQQVIRLQLNVGERGFIDASGQLPRVPLGAATVALADFDQDGDLDVFVGSYTYGVGSPLSELWANDGSGLFTHSAGAIPPRNEGASAVDVGDVNGDGNLDVFAAGFSQYTLFLGDGAGSFTDGTLQLPAPPAIGDRQTNALVLADLDGDGDLDAYTANGEFDGPSGYHGNYGDGDDQLLINDGSGVFTVDPSHVSAEHVGQNLVAADFDMDGDVDIVAGSLPRIFLSRQWGGLTRYYENQGNGSFVLAPEPIGFADSLVAGDVDGDGDPDLVQRFRVLTNTQRSLSLRTTPRPGRSLTLLLHGEANSPFVLAVSQRRANLVTDFGALFLDPNAILFTVPGQTGSKGRALRTFEVPVELVGETAYWQALVGAPPQSTNFMSTVFLAY